MRDTHREIVTKRFKLQTETPSSWLNWVPSSSGTENSAKPFSFLNTRV
jgi:hypothetical protein